MPEGDLKVICDDSAMIQDEKLWHWHKMAQDQPLESLELLECYAMLRMINSVVHWCPIFEGVTLLS